MKMFIVTIIILALILGPVACENCPETPAYFSIKGLDIFNALFTGQGLNPWRGIQNNESIPWDNYFMRIDFEKTYYSENKKSNGAVLYADCPVNGYLGSKIGIDTLYVVSLKDYNNQHERNDTINNIISVNDWIYNPEDFDKFYPITNYIEKNRANISNNVFELKLMEPPSDDIGEYQFKIIYILDNGEFFIKESGIVKLMK